MSTGARAFSARLFSRDTGGMLLRNSVVSCTVFAVGLLALWLLVDGLGMSRMIALVLSLLLSNSLHYILGRTWIFPGSERGVATGYLLFLINAGIGILITMALFAALTRWTAIHYLVIRIFVSLVAGLAIFLLNAVFTFRRV